MQHTISLRGTGIAIITPFTPQGDIDYTALAGLIEFWISGGVEYLVVMGTTGESVTLEKQEKTDLLNFCAEKINGRVPLVLGLGGNNTREIIHSLSYFDLQKASAVLSVSPYYNKPSQAGILAHYRAFAEACPLPVILYNVPGRTGSNVLPETTLQLARECENIIAVKEASGNVEQIMQIIRHKPDNFLVISGDDAITLPLLGAGADGVISVVANAYPKEFSDMVRFAQGGAYPEARVLHYRLLDVIQHLFTEGNPGGIKCVMKMKNLCEEYMRLPLVPVSDTLREKIGSVLL